MPKIILLDPLGRGASIFGHCHYLRDWSGHYNPGYVPLPPLDLMYAAAYLISNGCEAKIIEGSIKHLTHKKIIEIIKKEHPDYVFLPSTSLSLDDDKDLSLLIRKNIPYAKVIFAGPLVTHQPSLVLSDKSADFAVLGEYESPLLNITKGDYSENIAYLSGNKVICGRRSLVDLDKLPLPARQLIDNQAYRFVIFNKRNPVTTMTISRGCPYGKCEFCNSSLFALGKIRYRNIGSITEELNDIVSKYRIGEIFFKDQAFTANRELVWKMCEYILSNNIDISWRVSTRVDLVDKELLALMHKAGCHQISFGFESYSQDALDILKKGITIGQSKHAARLAKETGMEVMGFFIFGSLRGIKVSLAELFKFISILDVDYAQFNRLEILPGAPFYGKYVSGRPMLPAEESAKRGAEYAYLRFYFRPGYLFKQLAKIKSWDDVILLTRIAFDAFLFLILPLRGPHKR